MSTYRTEAFGTLGRSQLTIVRDDQLVAVVVNGDQELAERICALLNGDRPVGVHVESSVEDWDGVVSASIAPQCDEETLSWDHFTPEQVDRYWIRCTLLGQHDQHKDEHTGLTWRTEAQP